MQNYLTPNFSFAPMIPDARSATGFGIPKDENTLTCQAVLL